MNGRAMAVRSLQRQPMQQKISGTLTSRFFHSASLIVVQLGFSSTAL